MFWNSLEKHYHNLLIRALIFYFINENYNFNKLFKMAKKDVTLRKGLLFPNFDKHLDGLEDLKNTSGVREAVDKYHKELKDDKEG